MSSSLKALAFSALISLGVAYAAQAKNGQQVVKEPPPKIPQKLPPQTKKQLEIARPGSSDWNKSSLDPRAVLKNCDNWFDHLKSASAETRFVYAVGDNGQFGFTRGEIAIADPRKFRAAFGHIYREKGDYAYHEGKLVADGTNFQRWDEREWSKPTPVSASRLPRKDLLPFWVEHYQELIFSGLGTQNRPLTALFDAAKAAGFHATTEHRSLSMVTQTGTLHFSQNRVLLSGTISIGGRKTNLVTEVLIDEPSGALLKVTQFRKFGNRTWDAFSSYWTAKWNLKPGQVFDPTLFNLVWKKPS